MHTQRSHSNSHQQLNTSRWRTRTQKWPWLLETGVEVAGELSNLINRGLKHTYPARNMRWTTAQVSAAAFGGLWLWLHSHVLVTANGELSNLYNKPEALSPTHAG
jgi:hypothetical protein